MSNNLPKPNINQKSEEKDLDLSDPIVQVLLETDFVTKETLAATGPDNAPEYQVLKLLVEKGDASQEVLEQSIASPLLPVAVRNLAGADIIVEEGDTYHLSTDAQAKISA